jgi:hypothetical protein
MGMALALVGAFGSQVTLGQGVVVRGGQPSADIVVAEKPPRTVKLAASELQDILAKMTGAKLDIVTVPGTNVGVHLYVGRSAHTDALKISDAGLDSDAFRLVSVPHGLVLLGHDFDYVSREPYAHDGSPAEKERVYREWDKLTGAKWDGPHTGEWGYFSKTLGIDARDGRGSLNAVYAFLRGLGCRWYSPGELGEIVPKTPDVSLTPVDRTVRPDFPVRYMYFYYNPFSYAPADELKWQLRLGLNTVPTRQSAHGLMMVHGRDETKQAHPEYYALWNGKRATDHDRWGAPCLSSPGLFEETVRYVRAQYDIYDAKIVSVGPCDSYFMLCQCDLCKGKDAPERGWDGQLSDYVWDFINRVATEVYKTHPDRLVSGPAYSAYQLPPGKIDTLSPNVTVVLCQGRMGFHDASTRQRFEELTQAWLAKLPSKSLSLYEYYLAGWLGRSPYDGVPVYFPQSIADNLRFLKGKSQGEYVETFRSRHGKDDTRDILYYSHLNIYVTAQFYWDAGQSLDALLDEYYTLYYGPAAKEMKAFVEYAEANWPVMVKKPQPIDRAQELLAAARTAAGETVYGKRIQGIVDYMEPLKALREKVAEGRKNVPETVAVQRTREGALDGRLDKPFWKDVPVHELKDLVTGGAPTNRTTFRMAWDGEALVFGIRCEDTDMAHLSMSARKNEDANLFNDDAIELLLETGARSYYQIVVNPAGFMVDVDRENRIETRWTSSAQAAAYRGDTFWSIEVRVPVAGPNAATIDPLNGLAGEKPTETAPWYFNVCRQRIREGKTGHFAFSPTGSPNFHVPMKFAKLVVKP